MALIKLDRGMKVEKERIRAHESVDWTYTTFENDLGEKFIQVDTMGRDSRKFAGKVSQTIQFDRESAIWIKRLIESTFSLR